MNSKKPVIFKEDLSPERLAVHLGAAHTEKGGFLSVDCEMMGLKPWRDRLCLVQICDEHENISLIQISAEQQEAPLLKKIFEDTQVTKIFHFARADLAFLSYQLGINVDPIYCTKIASKLARTYTEKHGLRELAREFLNIDLNKNQQSSDWGQDNLSTEQVEYAKGDIIYLNQFRNKLTEMLHREGRYDLAERCFKQVPLMVELDLLQYEFVFEHHPPKS
ncbi:MAG: hypothetical protein SFT81_04765 [Candidatus Caenarcaniphilales bacterium]|nr:hypothetical protein [Candidatus Caenarcaniphilales bacterium]